MMRDGQLSAAAVWLQGDDTQARAAPPAPHCTTPPQSQGTPMGGPQKQIRPNYAAGFPQEKLQTHKRIG